jgi:hypothetical protein
MKINSHLLGLGIGAVIVAGWMWYTDKEIGKFLGYTIIKRKGKFVAERLGGERDTNPTFSTLDEVHAWVTAQQAQSAAANLATSIPWMQ